MHCISGGLVRAAGLHFQCVPMQSTLCRWGTPAPVSFGSLTLRADRRWNSRTPMWTDAFKALSSDPMGGRFLAEGALPRWCNCSRTRHCGQCQCCSCFGRAAASGGPVQVVFADPDANPSKSREILFAVAFGELAKNVSQARSRGGGILFVTQQIACARSASASQVGQHSVADVFSFVPFDPTRGLDWKTIHLANPGRMGQRCLPLRSLSAIIIDASHPRDSSAHLPELFGSPGLTVPLQVVVAPPHEWLIANAKQSL